MKHIKLDNGFEADINESMLDDMELLDLLVEVDGGDISVYPKIMKKLLPDDDKKRLYDAIRTEDGRVPMTEFGSALTQMFNQLQAAKK